MAFKRFIIRRVGPLSWLLELIGELVNKVNKSNTHPLAIASYCLWFILLTRLLYIATGYNTPDFADALGMHFGLGLGLLALLGVPYIIERYRAKQNERSISWFFIMTGTTVIALLLTVGGLYGRVNTVNPSAISAPIADPPGTKYVKDANGNTHRLVPYSGDYDPLPNAQTNVAPPTHDSKGWTEENTGVDFIDPYAAAAPTGTRYYRDFNGTIFRVYPPGIRSDLPAANPFGLADSTADLPPQK